MNSEYRASLAVLLMLSLLILAVAAVLVVLYLHETHSGLLTSTNLDALKKQLLLAPNDDVIKQRIREEDLRLRQEHFRNRARFHWGAYLLTAAVIAWLAVARRHFRIRKSYRASASTLEEDIRSLDSELAKLHAQNAEDAARTGASAGAEAVAALESRLAEMRAKVAEMEAEMAHLAFHARERGRQPAAETRRQVFWTLGIVGGLFLGLLMALGLFGTPDLPPEAHHALRTQDAPARAAAPTPAPVAELPLEPAAPDETWPFFRGPNAGVAAAGDWPTTWSVAENRHVLWKTPVPHPGKSSPVVWGKKIFLTGGDAENHQVMCFDADTGALLWDARVDLEILDKLDIFEDTGFAAPTPATDGRRVYAIFPTGHLAAFDFAGNQVWAIRLGTPESVYGYASSLLVIENVLIVQYDQGDDAHDNLSKLLGIDAATGNFLYQEPRPVGSSWASPTLIQTPNGPQVITSASELVIAHDPFSGKELWRVAFKAHDVAASAAFGGGLVFITNDSAELIAIRPDGTGDVTETHVLWRAYEGLPDTASPVSDGAVVLQAAAGGMLTAYDAQTGALWWEKFIPENATASFIIAGERAYLANEDGSTLILKPGPQYEPAGTGEVGEPVFATPAFVKNRIYIRGRQHLFGIGE